MMRLVIPVLAFALMGCGGPTSVAQNKASVEQTTSEIDPISRVNDQANILDPKLEASLTARSSDLEAQTGNQFVILTVPSLQGREIDVFARDYGNRHGIGRKGVNDGVLLVIAPNERKVRIAVGDGLSTKLSDRDARAIIDGVIVPEFRKGDLPKGIDRGADRIIEQLSGGQS